MTEVHEEGMGQLENQVEKTPRRSTRISRTLNSAGPSPYVPDLVRRSRSRSRNAKRVLKADITLTTETTCSNDANKNGKKKIKNKTKKNKKLQMDEKYEPISATETIVNSLDGEDIAEVIEILSDEENGLVVPSINIIPFTPIKRNTVEDNSVPGLCENLIPTTPVMSNTKLEEYATPSNVSATISKTHCYRENPTPFKQLQPIDNIEDDVKDLSINIVNNQFLNASKTILKSIRKRSISLSERPKTINRVTFCSPSNSIVVINQIDEIMRSNQKSNQFENITKRRKRSLSLSEVENTRYKMEAEAKKFLPNQGTALWGKEISNKKLQKTKLLVESTPEKLKRLPVPTSRTKLPNFAAIHQNNFNKMESLNDHVTRKAERARLLTSASKTKNASAQKSSSTTNSNSSLKESNNLKPTETRAPKARQKIDLSQVTLLPKPKINESLSISLMGAGKKGLSSSKSKLNTTTAVAFGSTISFSEVSQKTEDKFAQRQKRLADLYKGRNLDKTKEDSNKKREIIRGVRSNRRFELQMESRNRRMK